VTGGTANTLVLNLALIDFNYSEDLIKDQWYGIEQERLLQVIC